MSVKRYDFEFCQLVECENGHYILHSDYAPLLARHNALVEAVGSYQAASAEVDRLIAEVEG